MIFWLVLLKLEISCRVIVSLIDGLWFLLEDVLKIIFLHGEIYLSFHNSSFAFFRGGEKKFQKKFNQNLAIFLIEKTRIIAIEDSLKLIFPHFGEKAKKEAQSGMCHSPLPCPNLMNLGTHYYH
jgi:hypothetical protein